MAIELIEFNGMDKESIETVAKNARIKLKNSIMLKIWQVVWKNYIYQ